MKFKTIKIEVKKYLQSSKPSLGIFFSSRLTVVDEGGKTIVKTIEVRPEGPLTTEAKIQAMVLHFLSFPGIEVIPSSNEYDLVELRGWEISYSESLVGTWKEVKAFGLKKG